MDNEMQNIENVDVDSEDFFQKVYTADPISPQPVEKRSVAIPKDQFTEPSNSDDFWFSKRSGRQSINKGLEGVDGAASKQHSERSNKKVSKYIQMQLAEPYHNLKELFSVYDKDTTNYAAIQAKISHAIRQDYDLVESEYFSNEMLRLKSQKTDASRKKVEKAMANFAKSRPQVRDYLDSICGQFDFLEVLEKIYLDLEICGNGYLEVGRTATGGIGYLGYVRASTVRVREERDGFVQIAGSKHIFFRNYKDLNGTVIGTDANPNELVHFQKFTPLDSYYGAPDYISSIRAMTGNSLAENYNIEFFDNKAVPSHVVTLKGNGFNRQQVTNMIKFMENLKNNNHRTMVVPIRGDNGENKNEFKIEKIESSTQDFSFGDYLKTNVGEILRSHRTPITKVGTAEGVDMAAVRDGDKNFKENVVSPLQALAHRKINPILREITNIFEFKLREKSINNGIEESTIETGMYKNNAILSNEIRKRHGYAPLENGDKTYSEVETERQELDRKANDSKTRERDDERQENKTDSVGRERSAPGEGRTQE